MLPNNIPIFRTFFSKPSSDGAKQQWAIVGGAANAAAATNKAANPPTAPSTTTGIRSTTNAEICQINFPTLSGLISANEYINWLRVWIYFNGAIPTGQTVSARPSLDVSAVGESITIPEGVSGWYGLPKFSPFMPTSGALINDSTVPRMQLSLNEVGTQTGFTEVSEIALQVGVSSLEHIIPSNRNLVGVNTGLKFQGSFAQYGSLVFDAWMATGDRTSQLQVLKNMRARDLDAVRIFIPFNYMMVSYDQLVLNKNPSVYTRFNDASGTTADDLTDNNNNGTYVNTPTLNASPLLPGDATKTTTLTAAQSEEITIPNSSVSTNASIGILFKWSAGTAIFGDNTSSGGWRAFDNAGTFTVTVGGTAIATSLATSTVRNNVKHSLYISKSGANVTVYVDGVAVGSSTSAGNTAASMPWHIGRNGTATAYSDITISDFFVVSSAISTSNIKQLSFADSNPPQPNEIRWIFFEDFLDACDEAGMHVGVTGLVTFWSLPDPTWRAPWLDDLPESDRWAAFARWWKRCAQASCKSPSVIYYDIINEPLTQNGGSSWYITPGGLSYGSYLNKDLSGRTKAQVATNFMNTMKTEIRKWDPATPCAYGLYEYDQAWITPSDIILAHWYPNIVPYLFNEEAINRLRDLYLPANKPIIEEEVGYQFNWAVSQGLFLQSYFTQQGSHALGGPNWVGAFESYASISFQNWSRANYIWSKRVKEANRVSSIRNRVDRVGQRFY